MRILRRALSTGILVLLVAFVILGTPSRTVSENRVAELDPALVSALALQGSEDPIPVVVVLRAQANVRALTATSRAERQQMVIEALQRQAEATQGALLRLLELRQGEGQVVSYTPLWIQNAILVEATAPVIDELARRPEVEQILLDEEMSAPDMLAAMPLGAAAAEPNIGLIDAPALWDLGFTGQGIVIASMDTGVSYTHPDLLSRWRGGTNSWYDPYGQHPGTPVDLNGHGTQTMGVMVGGDSGGTSIGVAPGASWIAVKMFNDSGSATTGAIHLGFQWLLDPDGDPSTADAPHLVNNSWTLGGPGCNLEFELDLLSLVAAGITPVFAAGNFGPYGATSPSPSNNPSAFAVGATDNLDAIYYYSSRGPNSCGLDVPVTYPDVVAPGVNVRTTERYALYTNATGTSLAAPHVSGALALLLSASPELTVAQQRDALSSTAVDLGAIGPDDTYGTGRIDVLAAFDAIGGGTLPTPTPVPATFTPTPVPPTATPTATSVPVDNLALGKPIAVSSFQDDGHSGDMAVDGSLGTWWQTKKAVGKRTLSEEWIEVDLGASASIDRVVLEWEAYYATSYAVLVSGDGSSWSTAFSTSGGDGGNDTIALGSHSARYLRIESTAWSDGVYRSWLRELEIYGTGGGSSSPTPTPVPPTATPVPPTPTPDAGASTHVGDLDGASTVVRNRWDATVTIAVHDEGEVPVSGATVTAIWDGDPFDSASCTTDGSGTCTVTKRSIKSNVSSVVLAVSEVSHDALFYQPASNHDPDGDSDGSQITVWMP